MYISTADDFDMKDFIMHSTHALIVSILPKRWSQYETLTQKYLHIVEKNPGSMS